MIIISPAKMKIARRLNGSKINGYSGYYGNVVSDGTDFFIIAIPHGQVSVSRLMREIESKE